MLKVLPPLLIQEGLNEAQKNRCTIPDSVAAAWQGAHLEAQMQGFDRDTNNQHVGAIDQVFKRRRWAWGTRFYDGLGGFYHAVRLYLGEVEAI